MIDRSTIDRIMASADIVDVVKDFVSLRKSGTNYKGLCPFHDERTPSFMVSPTKQLCKCFSCGKGGNVVTFLMEHEQLSFPEALKWLGKRYGIEVRDKEQTAEQKAAATERESMFVVNEFARDFFVRTLRETVDGMAIGMSYFRRRGLRDDIIKKFQLGFSPEDREALAQEARAKGYEDKFMVNTGLCIKTPEGKMFDRYAGRVIFPVHTISGRVVAFGGRTLLSKEEQKRRSIGKYVNSPESDIYSKKKELYGLYQAKSSIAKNDRVYLVEGYLDVISMHQSGVENVVASSGTSLTKEQVRLIHRFTSNVTVLYDGDAAGIHAALRGVDMLLAEGLSIKVLLLPDGEDPDSFAQSHSPEAFKQYIADHETDFITFKTDLLLKDAQGDPMRRASVIKDVVSSISVIPDNIVRQMYIHEFAGRMGIDENTIVNEVTIDRKRIRDGEREEAAREAARAAGQNGVVQGGAQGTTTASTPAQSAGASAGPMDEPPIYDDEGNIVNLPPQGPETPQTVTAQDAARFGQKTKAEKLLENTERQIMEIVIRYGGLPILLQPEVVERKFGEGAVKKEETDAETEDKPRQQPLIEVPDSPLVAPYISECLAVDQIVLRQPIYQRILAECAQMAEEAYEPRRQAREEGVDDKKLLPFFDALNYFKMHSDVEVSLLAEAVTDDRYILSTSQAQMFVPEERRLVDIVPRVVNDYKNALIRAEKEQLLFKVRQPEVQADAQALAEAMQQLSMLNQIESQLSAQLGGRVLSK